MDNQKTNFSILKERCDAFKAAAHVYSPKEFPVMQRMTEKLKPKDLRYALEVVSDEKGKGGRRGGFAAACKHEVPHHTVSKWVTYADHTVAAVAQVKSELAEDFKTEVVNHAFEISSEGKFKAGRRGVGEATRKHGPSPTTVQNWPAKTRSLFLSTTKSDITDELKIKAVHYASEIIPGGQGKGGRRGAYAAAQKYGLSQTTVHSWLQEKDHDFVSIHKQDRTKELKEKVLCYALKVIPGGKGKGGRIGASAAAFKYGIPRRTVQSWLAKLNCTETKAARANTDDFKTEVVGCAMEIIPGGKGKGGRQGAFEAACRYGLSQNTVRSWMARREAPSVSAASGNTRLIPKELKSKVVRYAMKIVPGGKGKGGSIGGYKAARRFGLSQTTVCSWLARKQRAVRSRKVSNISDKLKAKIIQYALEVVPGGKGKGGRRGGREAALKYGLSRGTVQSWLEAKDRASVKINRTAITSELKANILYYALEVIPGGKGKGGRRGVSEAALNYGLPRTTVRAWLKRRNDLIKQLAINTMPSGSEGTEAALMHGSPRTTEWTQMNSIRTPTDLLKMEAMQSGSEDVSDAKMCLTYKRASDHITKIDPFFYGAGRELATKTNKDEAEPVTSPKLAENGLANIYPGKAQSQCQTPCSLNREEQETQRSEINKRKLNFLPPPAGEYANNSPLIYIKVENDEGKTNKQEPYLHFQKVSKPIQRVNDCNQAIQNGQGKAIIYRVECQCNSNKRSKLAK